MDIFAGCGGLSLGLHQSGVAETKWAIECYDSAAKAFKANNPNTDVFTADCNLLLKIIMEAEAEGNKFTGEIIQAAQLTHERFFTLDHCGEIFF